MKKLFVTHLTFFLLWIILSLFWANLYISSLWKTSDISPFLQKDKLDLGEFWEVYDIIEEDFFSDAAIKKDELIQGAIKWMVEALDDKHSEFMSPEVNKKFQEALSWDFEWIGAVVEKVPLGVKVERILKWSPAKKYDVRSGDIIVSANGVELEELDIYDAVEKIKWPAWTQVLLKIIRPGEEKILEIAVVRDKIHIPSVEEIYFEEEKIAYISLNMYWETTAWEFHEALENVKKSQSEGLIIDVRDNGGGYLQSAVEILSEFIPEGEVLVKTRYKNSFLNQNYFSINGGEIFDKKIVVLINSNSASASEITAWALREYDKAILVWEKTYGKWSVQEPFSMDDGSLLKLTVAKWFTPKWVNIDDEWIEPDIEIEFQDEDYENSYDRQLEEAKKILRSFIEKGSIALSIEDYINAESSTEE